MHTNRMHALHLSPRQMLAYWRHGRQWEAGSFSLQPASSIVTPYLCVHVAGLFSMNAAMPSFWSLRANMEWKMRLSKRTPSCSKEDKHDNNDDKDDKREMEVWRGGRCEADDGQLVATHRQSHLVGSVNGFLRHGHGGLRERGNLVSHLYRQSEPLYSYSACTRI